MQKYTIEYNGLTLDETGDFVSTKSSAREFRTKIYALNYVKMTRSLRLLDNLIIRSVKGGTWRANTNTRLYSGI